MVADMSSILSFIRRPSALPGLVALSTEPDEIPEDLIEATEAVTVKVPSGTLSVGEFYSLDEDIELVRSLLAEAGLVLNEVTSGLFVVKADPFRVNAVA